jgi:Asp-tRNA(Asn)/Glu-tRNA(Gln) amidotransferase A subunit family amidase
VTEHAIETASELLFTPATEAASFVRRKQVSARELTEALLARIDAVKPAVNAVVELRAEQALAEADVDAFLCPVNFTPAFPHDDRPFDQRTISTPEGERPYDSQPFWIAHASLPGLPAVAAPIGATGDGLPWVRRSSARSTKTTPS